MTVRLRLQRKGTKKRPFYRIVAADQRAPRDGRYIEQLGIYDPLEKPAVVNLDVEKVEEWIGKGAQTTDTVRIIIRKFKAGETQTKEELEARNRQARKDRQAAAAKGVEPPAKPKATAEEAPEEKAAAESEPAETSDAESDEA